MDLGPAGRGGARRRTRRRMSAVNAASTQKAQSPSPQATTSSSDPANMLEMLKTLHEAGILTDSEYTSKKLQVVELM